MRTHLPLRRKFDRPESCGAEKLFRFAHALVVNIADEQLGAGLVKPTG